MASCASKVVLHVRFAWWLRPWLFCLVSVAAVFGAEPDWDKVGRVVRRAVRVKVI